MIGEFTKARNLSSPVGLKLVIALQVRNKLDTKHVSFILEFI